MTREGSAPLVETRSGSGPQDREPGREAARQTTGPDTIDLLIGRLTERAKRALRLASVRDGIVYVDTFAGVPARLIDCQVWGRGDQLNTDGLTVRTRLLQSTKESDRG